MTEIELLPGWRPMSYSEPRNDDESNLYAPPRAELGERTKSPGEIFVMAYQGRARAIRFVAASHLAVAYCLLVLGPPILSDGIHLWNTFSHGRGNDSKESEAVAHHRQGLALEHVGAGSSFLLLSVTNAVIGLGLWRFRRSAGLLAMTQGFFLLAIGFMVAMYALFRYDDPSSVVAMIPGLFFVFFAGFVRSKRSVVVCSDAYRKARPKISGG